MLKVQGGTVGRRIEEEEKRMGNSRKETGAEAAEREAERRSSKPPRWTHGSSLACECRDGVKLDGGCRWLDRSVVRQRRPVG